MAAFIETDFAPGPAAASAGANGVPMHGRHRQRLRSTLESVCQRYGTSSDDSRCAMKNNRKVTYLLNYGSLDYAACFQQEKDCSELKCLPNNYLVCFEASANVWIGRIAYQQRIPNNNNNNPADDKNQAQLVPMFDVMPIDKDGNEIPSLASGLEENISSAVKKSFKKFNEHHGLGESLEKSTLRPNGRLYIGVYYEGVQEKLKQHFKNLVALNSDKLNYLAPDVREKMNVWLGQRMTASTTDGLSAEGSDQKNHFDNPLEPASGKDKPSNVQNQLKVLRNLGSKHWNRNTAPDRNNKSTQLPSLEGHKRPKISNSDHNAGDIFKQEASNWTIHASSHGQKFERGPYNPCVGPNYGYGNIGLPVHYPFEVNDSIIPNRDLQPSVSADNTRHMPNTEMQRNHSLPERITTDQQTLEDRQLKKLESLKTAMEKEVFQELFRITRKFGDDIIRLKLSTHDSFSVPDFVIQTANRCRRQLDHAVFESTKEDMELEEISNEFNVKDTTVNVQFKEDMENIGRASSFLSMQSDNLLLGRQTSSNNISFLVRSGLEDDVRNAEKASENVQSSEMSSWLSSSYLNTAQIQPGYYNHSFNAYGLNMNMNYNPVDMFSSNGSNNRMNMGYMPMGLSMNAININPAMYVSNISMANEPFPISNTEASVTNTNAKFSSSVNPGPIVVNCNMTPQALYLTLDVDGNKSIGEKEIKRALRCLRIPVSSSIVSKTYEACDKNGDGKISMEEFVTFLSEREEELRSLFEKIDLNGDGHVTSDELKEARKRGLFEASDEEIQKLISWMDNLENGNKNGMIDFEEFRTSMVLFPPATTLQEIIECLRAKSD